MKDYETYFETYSKASKSKLLLEAIKIAQKMILQKKAKTNCIFSLRYNPEEISEKT